MPLIATDWIPRAGRRRPVGPLIREQRVRQFCQLVTAGRLPDIALKRVGLTWWQLAETIRRDDTGQLAAQFDNAQQFGAHALAARSVRVTAARVRSMPEATAMGHRQRSLQWLASRLNPTRYGTTPAESAPAAVVHHVIHLPTRGPAPDLAEIAVIGADAIVTGSLNRQLSSGGADTVRPIVRNGARVAQEPEGMP